MQLAYAGTPEPVPAPTTRSDFSTTGWTITDRGEVWTMQEPYGAYTWYPVNDQPSDKALYDFTLTAPAPVDRHRQRRARPSRGESTATPTTRGTSTEPASSYLVTVAIGDYAHCSTDRERPAGLP